MQIRRFLLFLAFFLVIAQRVDAQKDNLHFGLQFRPMLPVRFINAGNDETLENNVQYLTKQNFGHAPGALIRYDLKGFLALETGITFVQRNYTLSIDSLNNDFTAKLDYRIIGYEIPFNVSAFIILDPEWYMSATVGGSLNLFPSDVSSFEFESGFLHETVRYRWAQSGVNANFGFEYRPQGIGMFYIGGSFHIPFSHIYLSKIGYFNRPLTESSVDLRGSYLTLDLRYYFPEKKRNRKK